MTGFQRDVNQSHVSSTIPSTLSSISSRDGNEFDIHESYVDISADKYTESKQLEEQYIYERGSDALPNDTNCQDRNVLTNQSDKVICQSRMHDTNVSTYF